MEDKIIRDENIIETEEITETSQDKADLNKTRIMKMLRPVINIAWMYPDTLYLHGERGNVMALTRYAQFLGLEPKIHKIDMGSGNFNPMDYDILFYGPGEISSFKSVMKDIGTYTRSLAEYAASGKILLVTGTTVSMFGERIRRFDPDAPNGLGEVIEGLCLIPVLSDEREYVFGDDLDVRAEFGGYSMELLGSQIQMADIEFLENSSFTRFGSVIYGRGNNGEDGMEGVIYNNCIFTNLLGPLLVNNPWLTVQILKTAAANKGIEIKMPDPDYSLEVTSLHLKKEFIDNKQYGEE
jgi:CobQ-like glutamine amidotransferase family enzyme